MSGKLVENPLSTADKINKYYRVISQETPMVRALSYNVILSLYMHTGLYLLCNCIGECDYDFRDARHTEPTDDRISRPEELR